MSRDSGYPQVSGGNIAVDFVWGPFPMQPDDDRTGSATNIGGGQGDVNFSPTTMVNSVALTKTAITKNLNNGLTSSVPNNHSVVVNNWNGYPDYTPVAPFLDTTDQAAIPNVVGALEAAATSTLTTAGFVKGAVTTTGVGATTVNDGKVKTQTPAAATVANLGTSVALVKYLAPTVPDVLGLTEAAATTALQSAGLVKGDVTTSDVGATTVNDGKVKTQDPVSGGKVDSGSAVDLVLYAAPTVPDVLGLGNMAAQAAIEAVGLVYSEGDTTTDGATAENDGQVASQSPVAGGKADTGSVVSVSLYEFLG